MWNTETETKIQNGWHHWLTQSPSSKRFQDALFTYLIDWNLQSTAFSSWGRKFSSWIAVALQNSWCPVPVVCFSEFLAPAISWCWTHLVRTCELSHELIWDAGGFHTCQADPPKMTDMCCINSLWRHKTWSTLAQVMACCLTAPSHYLNQCWLIITKVQSHSSGNHFTKDTSAINHWNQFENYLTKFSFKSPRGQWVKIFFHHIFQTNHNCHVKNYRKISNISCIKSSNLNDSRLVLQLS